MFVPLVTQHTCTVLYHHMGPVWLYHISTYYLKNGMTFGKSYWTQNACFDLTTFIWNISHSKKNSARHYHKCVQVFMKHIHYCQILIEIFQKVRNTKFHENLSSGSRAVLCKQMNIQRDRHDEAGTSFLSLSPSHIRTHTNSTTTSKAWTRIHSKVLHIYQLLCIYTTLFNNTTILSDIPQLWMQTSKAVFETPLKTEHTLRAMKNKKYMMKQQ